MAVPVWIWSSVTRAIEELLAFVESFQVRLIDRASNVRPAGREVQAEAAGSPAT
jgi:hypothetical protein